MLSSLLMLALVGCDRSGDEYTPQPVAGYDGILDLGRLEPVSLSQVGSESDRRALATYASVTVPREQLFGGVTATFQSNGGQYCIVVDPEAVTWNQSVDLQDPNSQYRYADNTDDDGDLDLSVGLSANYTGTPDLEMGNFEQAYEDSLGNVVTVNTNECVFLNRNGQPGAHAGRATPELCNVNTALHPDREYTIALDTWSLPMDDDLLSFGLLVVEGVCSDLITDAGVGLSECIIPNESCTPQREASGECRARELNFEEAEKAYCWGGQGLWCGCTTWLSVDNPMCNSCNELGTVSLTYDGTTLTMSEHNEPEDGDPADCTTEVKATFSTDTVDRPFHCADF